MILVDTNVLLDVLEDDAKWASPKALSQLSARTPPSCNGRSLLAILAAFAPTSRRCRWSRLPQTD